MGKKQQHQRTKGNLQVAVLCTVYSKYYNPYTELYIIMCQIFLVLLIINFTIESTNCDFDS
jgi:hypothetical protein